MGVNGVSGRIYQHDLDLKMEADVLIGNFCHQQRPLGDASMDSSPSSQSSSGSSGGRNRKCKVNI